MKDEGKVKKLEEVKKLEGILKSISSYETLIDNKTLSNHQFFKTMTVSSLNLLINPGQLTQYNETVEFHAYIGSEMINKKMTYTENTRKLGEKGHLGYFEIIEQELIPEDKNLPRYKVIDNIGFA